MTWHRCRLVVAALVSVLALTACGGLPETSPVTEGRRLDEPITDQFRVAAPAPIEGSTPEEIARGFIQAGADDDETHATAKSYLTPSTVDLWRWASSDIVVYNDPSDLTVERSGDGVVKASVRAVGMVSPDGRYHDALPGTVLRTTFGVTKVGGEWRLEVPREGFGLWLDAASFDRLYTPRPIFYVAVSTHLLVPDMRWFLASPTRLPTSLARAQLEPVPSYLEGAVTTGIPKGTGLAVNSVPVDGGQAQIDLTSSALDAGPVDRRAMWAQLSATLAQASITSISISAEGTGLDLPNVGSVVTSPGELGFDYAELPQSDSVLLRSGQTISRIDPGRIPEGSAVRDHPNTAPRASDPSQIPGWWTDLALSWDGSQVAAVANRSQVQIWAGKREPMPLTPFGTALTRPNYDNHGFLWVGGLDAKGVARIWALRSTTLDPKPQPAAVAVPWLGGRRVVGLKVAPDGARVLVATTNAVGGDVQLVLAGVVRSPNGTPVGLTTPLRLAEPLTEVTDLVWLDWQSYAVLGRVSLKDVIRPWIGTVGVGLDGLRAQQGQPDPSVARLAPVDNGVAITAAGDARRLVVVTDDGKVEAKAGVTWREILPGTTDFLVPGR